MSWEQSCSLKSDGGYYDYLRKKSIAPMAYTFSCVAPAACPDNGPSFSECRGFAPGGYRIPQETEMWRQRMTRGLNPGHGRPQTVMAGTSAFRGAGEGPTANVLDVDTQLKYSEPSSLGFCRRSLMEDVSDRFDILGHFVPRVEAFQPGGIPSRCNKLAYKANPTNAFINAAPVPPPSTIMTGVFKPNGSC